MWPKKVGYNVVSFIILLLVLDRHRCPQGRLGGGRLRGSRGLGRANRIARHYGHDDPRRHPRGPGVDHRTHEWGITVKSVEIRDVVIPPSLEDAMSRQAQAEREKLARVILGDAEVEIAEKFEKASARYCRNQMAFQLRAMNLLYEGVKERGSLMVVPSPMVQSMMDSGAFAGLAALDAKRMEIAKHD
jgi:hypothetical protein